MQIPHIGTFMIGFPSCILIILLGCVLVDSQQSDNGQQSRCAQHVDNQCSGQFRETMRAAGADLQRVCLAVDVLTGCVALASESCDAMDTAQLIEGMKRSVLATFSSTSCVLANASLAAYGDNPCSTGLALCFGLLAATEFNSLRAGSSANQTTNMDGAVNHTVNQITEFTAINTCLAYDAFSRCTASNLSSCSPSVLTLVTDKVRRIEIMAESPPYVCSQRQGQIRFRQCLDNWRTDVNIAWSRDQICQVYTQTKLCVAEAKELSMEPGQVAILEQEFADVTDFLEQPFCQNDSARVTTLPTVSHLDRVACNQMVDACSLQLQHGISSARGDVDIICQHVDTLLACLLPNVDNVCDPVARAEIVDTSIQVIAVYADPEFSNCSLQNANHWRLQQDACDVAIANCSSSQYLAETQQPANPSNACFHFDAYVQCTEHSLGACDVVRLQVVNEYVTKAKEKFHDHPYYCDERRLYDLEMTDNKLATCEMHFQSSIAAATVVGSACSALQALKHCLQETRKSASPRQRRQIDQVYSQQARILAPEPFSCIPGTLSSPVMTDPGDNDRSQINHNFSQSPTPESTPTNFGQQSPTATHKGVLTLTPNATRIQAASSTAPVTPLPTLDTTESNSASRPIVLGWIVFMAVTRNIRC